MGVASTGKRLQARKKREVGSADDELVWFITIKILSFSIGGSLNGKTVLEQ